jgi:hypothetical protein
MKVFMMLLGENNLKKYILGKKYLCTQFLAHHNGGQILDRCRLKTNLGVGYASDEKIKKKNLEACS